MRANRKTLAQDLASYPADFTVQVAASLLKLVPTVKRKSLKNRLPSYLESAESVDLSFYHPAWAQWPMAARSLRHHQTANLGCANKRTASRLALAIRKG
jgi:hypothetical protein